MKEHIIASKEKYENIDNEQKTRKIYFEYLELILYALIIASFGSLITVMILIFSEEINY